MNGHPFTEEQIIQLRQNPYVFNIVGNKLFLTKEFKEIFFAEYNQGNLPRSILEKYGFNTAILGRRRIWSISEHIRAEYKKYGEFHSGSLNPFTRYTINNIESGNKTLSEKDEIKQLRHEIEYLKQEIVFLKKISSIKHTQK